jgi:hypothetical protein
MAFRLRRACALRGCHCWLSHLIAPDYPGFGHSDAPSPDKFAYKNAEENGVPKHSELEPHYGLAKRNGNASYFGRLRLLKALEGRGEFASIIP